VVEVVRGRRSCLMRVQWEVPNKQTLWLFRRELLIARVSLYTFVSLPSLGLGSSFLCTGSS
jgi:hypothetical protein